MTFKHFLNSSYAQGLTKGQLDFFHLFLETNENIFLTSEAGCGKSFIIQRLTKFCKDHGILLSKTASTGVAAVNIEAQTIHSFLGMGLADTSSDILVKKINKNKLAKKRIQDCKILLIEECSMISGETFQKIYDILRHFKNKMPRIIVCGDFFQISAVFKNDKTYAFESDAWDLLKLTTLYLTEIIRQDKNSDYAKFLSRIRIGDVSDMSLLRERMGLKIPAGTLTVYSKNVDVDAHNLSELKKIEGLEKVYKSIDSGSEFYMKSLDRSCLAPSSLRLKIGAPVMLLKNNLENNLSNGSMGKVTALNESSVDVLFENGNFTIERDVWKIEESYLDDNKKIKTKILASRNQIPLRLGFSSSGHKIQSLTIDKIAVDLSNCFSNGLAYCMLSRAKKKEGLFITDFNPSSIRVDKRCIEFYKKISQSLKVV